MAPPAARFFALRLDPTQTDGILSRIEVATQAATPFAWAVARTGPTGPDSGSASAIASGTAQAPSPGGFASVTLDPRTAPYVDRGSVYWLVMDFWSTGNVPLVATSAPSIPPRTVLTSADQGTWVPLADDHQLVVGRVSITAGAQAIVAPGMYDLTGLPYVLLRIPEIESHMYRSRAFEAWNMPVAKFKMSVVGYADLRMDFATLKPRPFHPIGKLTALTFQFWGSDGFIYDFMGMNMSFTMVIRFFEPKQKHRFNDKILNPNYEPATNLQPPEEDSEDDDSNFESSNSDSEIMYT